MKKIILLITALFSYSFLFSAVEFMGFNATVVDLGVQLTWSTASETENVGFILERRIDTLSTWEPLTSYVQENALLGQGTVSMQTDYSYTDATTTSGTYYYRISGVDNASVVGVLDSLSITVTESAVQADIPKQFELTCYPNPFNPSIAISYSIFAKATMDRQPHVKALIYDLQGVLVKELLNSDMPAGSHELVWNAGGMPSGVYILKMIAGNMVQSQKLVLMK